MTRKEWLTAYGLMKMVYQWFDKNTDGTVSHKFMSAEEDAVAVLVPMGLMTETGMGWSLNWDLLCMHAMSLLVKPVEAEGAKPSSSECSQLMG